MISTMERDRREGWMRVREREGGMDEGEEGSEEGRRISEYLVLSSLGLQNGQVQTQVQ